MIPAEALKCIEGNQVTPGQIVFYRDMVALAIKWAPNAPGVYAVLLSGENTGYIQRLRNENLLVIANGYTVKAKVDHRYPHDRDTPWGALIIEDQPLIYASSGQAFERTPIKYTLAGEPVHGSDYNAIAFTTWQLHLCDPQGYVSEQPLLTVHAQDNS